MLFIDLAEKRAMKKDLQMVQSKNIYRYAFYCHSKMLLWEQHHILQNKFLMVEFYETWLCGGLLFSYYIWDIYNICSITEIFLGFSQSLQFWSQNVFFFAHLVPITGTSYLFSWKSSFTYVLPVIDICSYLLIVNCGRGRSSLIG